jgi:hypothetical protein
LLFEGEGPVLIGICGGIAAELVRWHSLRFTLHKGLPDWSKSPLYWIVTIGMAIAGGGLVYLYILSGTNISPFLALNIGASAPLLIGKLAEQAPRIDPGSVS